MTCSAPFRIAALAAAVFLPALVAAQQYSAWSPALNLGSPVNSPAAEGCAFVAKSELTLFVVSTRGDGFGGQDIYVAQRDSLYDSWGPLQNAGPAINGPGNELCPTLTIDGHRLFFVSDRPGGAGKQDLYQARRQNKRDDFGWQTAVNLGDAVNSPENDFTPSLYEDPGTGASILYFSSDRAGGAGSVDIYSSTLTGDGWFEPAFPVQELNTPLIDERPNVRRDGLEIFFDSNRPGSAGSTDLWVATRVTTADPWSAPVNLGPAINTASAETRPSLSFDGFTLYFGSNRPGGAGSSDIYVSTRTKVHGSE
jgi:hypothetical protein